ncbi:cytochrome c peroxidase [Pseudobacteriovorax antillogorgiicola]|uniref:Cytochrome c peroxidase n=2 Tax=Pseudobacteriovorax antillogorgiicola TaxID=1513793 RepID=A0A1Y6BP06_9BACT|nr:cytochrome c peroxidase [Pseudobacteriovorax antillogorgiicola]SMF12708.1 cytochrome c peroxidase [Pseudobacteriovorax antillogorgiicola]
MHRVLLYLLLNAGISQAANDKPSREVIWKKAQSLSPLIAPQLTPREFQQARFGKELFFDPRISATGDVACSSCHNPIHYFTDKQKTGRAIGVGKRNTPTVINSFALSWNFWDGRVDNLASQALKPIEDAAEHGSNRIQVYRVVETFYKKAYEAIWGKFPSIRAKVEHGMPRTFSVTLFPKVQTYLAKQLAVKATAQRGKKWASKRWLASKKLIFQGSQKPTWIKNFDSLSEADRNAIHTVFARAGIAIAQFERTVVANDAPFDRFMKRWQTSQTPLEQAFDKNFGLSEFRGLQVFLGPGRCINCHHGPAFSDQQFHNAGFPNDSMDLGRAEGLALLKNDGFACENPIYQNHAWLKEGDSCQEKPYLVWDAVELIGAFKTPTLRNVSRTGPYGHDGSFATLREVIEHYNNPSKLNNIGHLSESLETVELEQQEMQDLEAFLKSLTAPLKFL